MPTDTPGTCIVGRVRKSHPYNDDELDDDGVGKTFTCKTFIHSSGYKISILSNFCSSLIPFSLLTPPSPALLPSQFETQMSCIQPPVSPTTLPTRRGGDRQGSEYRWGQGQCFSLTNGLAWEETWDPCSGRPTARAHEEWGYCQVLSPPPPPPSPVSPPPSPYFICESCRRVRAQPSCPTGRL